MNWKSQWKKPWVKNLVFFALLGAVFLTDLPLWVNIQVTKFRLGSPPKMEASRATESVYENDIYVMNSERERSLFSQFKGRPVFINYWASWCVPCLAEFDALVELHATFPKLQMAIINVEDQDSFERYLKKTSHELPFLRQVSPLPKSLSSSAIPASILLDADGQVLFKHVGAFDWSSSEAINQIQSKL